LKRFPPLAHFAGGCVFNWGKQNSNPGAPDQERKKAHQGWLDPGWALA